MMEIKDCTVIYEGCIVEITARAIEEGLVILKEYDRNTRKHVLRSVQESLSNLLHKARNNSLSEQERQDFCDDVGIWFTEQVRTGNHAKYYQGQKH